jgi:protein-tyrosine phosphatase
MIKSNFNFKTTPCIFRSGNLYQLSAPVSKLIIDGLNLKCHIDLRSPDEIRVYGKPELLIKSGVAWHNFSLEQENSHLRRKARPTFIDYFKYYVELIQMNGDQINKIIKFMLATPYHSYLFSCYAGKDRTGIIILLIMGLLNREKEEVIADYHASKDKLLSQIAFFEKNWLAKKLTMEQYSKRFDCDVRTMEMLFEKIRFEYGGISNYFLKIGVTQKEQNQMQEKFYNYL